MALDYLGRLARARRLAAGGNANTEAAVLKAGEFGYVADTGDLKVGDGTTAFNALKSVRNHRRIRTITGTGTTLENNDEVLIVNNAGATSHALPAAASNANRLVHIVSRGGGTVTVTNQTGGGTIASGTGGRFISDGTTWYGA